MKIKTKLTLGVGLLFSLIVGLSVLAAVQVMLLDNATKKILQANYNTLVYSIAMLNALDDMREDPGATTVFAKNLELQKGNISEIGEAELTDKLDNHFQLLRNKPEDTVISRQIRGEVSEIMNLNLDAIQRKSITVEQTAEKANIWIAIIGTFCFLIAFTLLINLPGSIANPIKELTASIKEIAASNYHQRVDFEDHNEFGELAAAFNSMAQKLEEYNDSTLSQILFEKKRIDTLINNMHDPVIGFDDNHKILFANNEALLVLGLVSSDLLGKQAQEVALRNDLMRSLIKEVVLDDGTATGNPAQPIKIFAHGKESYFQKELLGIAITPTGESATKSLGYVIILRNITVFKELDFAKTNFIATVSHELKTPIASIKMSVQLLENLKTGHINEEQSHLIASIKDDTNRLLKITGELLNMTQIESGNVQISMVPTDAMDIVQYAVNANRLSAEQKGVQIELGYPANLPQVLADMDKTAWVLTNLLSNALRYSYENTAVSINLSHKADKIYFAVHDKGPGIAPEYQHKIFNRYFQVPGSQKEGSGLGLAISKEFIEAQGGQLLLDSEIGSGSTFTICLNAAPQTSGTTDAHLS